MKPALEPPREQIEKSSVVAFARKEMRFLWNWHFHPEYELTLIRRGSGTRLIGDHSGFYGKYDLVLIGANLPHTWSSRESGKNVRGPNEAVVVQFRTEMFPKAVLALPEFAIVDRMLAMAVRGLHFSSATGRNVEADMIQLLNLSGIHRWLKVTEILAALAHCRSQTLASTRYRDKKSFQQSSRIGRVLSYLEQHYRGDISVSDVAHVAGLTPNAFSRFFRKFTHQTFVHYRNVRRIREACRLLEETDLSVTEIAHECGFCNLANFNRRFLEITKTTPRRYRTDRGEMI